jgi:hypothetical protein
METLPVVSAGPAALFPVDGEQRRPVRPQFDPCLAPVWAFPPAALPVSSGRAGTRRRAAGASPAGRPPGGEP